MRLIPTDYQLVELLWMQLTGMELFVIPTQGTVASPSYARTLFSISRLISKKCKAMSFCIDNFRKGIKLKYKQTGKHTHDLSGTHMMAHMVQEFYNTVWDRLHV